MRGNANSAVAGAVVESDLLDDMAVFDLLPTAIRDRLNAATVKFPAISVAQDLDWIERQGVPPDRAITLELRQIAANEADIARAENIPLPKGHPFA